MNLYVDIEKQIGDFKLNVRFNAENEVFAVLGASGCGKSMTLKCIAGIEKPDRGLIKLNDRVLFDSDKHINIPVRKRRVGYLFQDYALFPNMTVLQNIMCAQKDKNTAMEYVKRFYLDGKENLYPEQLSGGQQQRTALARMLASTPEIIMLDEPFSALDHHLKMKLERHIMNVIDQFDGVTLFVSHDRDEVYRLTDRIAVMDNGSVLDIQSKESLFKSPKTLAAALLTGCKNVSSVEMIDDHSLLARDWGIVIVMNKVYTDKRFKFIGIRAHYFEAATNCEEINTIECEIVRVIENPFSVSVLFKNKNMSNITEYGYLTYELSKEDWERLKGRPLFLKISEKDLMFME